MVTTHTADAEDSGHMAVQAVERTARCACGSLTVTVVGEPARVYACACIECQRATGSTFAYRARFRQEAIRRVEGERRVWRRSSDAGRWIEQSFCPRCGALVFMEGEAIPGEVALSVGCFADGAFAPPAALFWAARRHPWYALAEGIRLMD
jgi:hypothetical protein